MTNRLLVFVIVVALCACQSKKLPIIGEPEEVTHVVDGKEVTETVYPTIPDFSFTNQRSETVTQDNFKGKIYIADFFFTTCPTICPVMKKNMLKVYDRFKDHPDVRILSHSIDPEHDTPAVLSEYAKDLGVSGNMWTFVTGEREKIYDIGQKHYLVSASADPDQPGGFIHSGAFVLVDKDRHIRGMYDGTSETSTAQLIRDIHNLLDNP